MKSKRKDRPQRPRHRIDVACPHCGASQQEPSLAVSTYCRNCSGHFDIEHGVAVAPRKPALILPDPAGPRASGASGAIGRASRHPGHALRALLASARKHLPLAAGTPRIQPATCFECGMEFEFSPAAASCQCPACGSHFTVDDVHVRTHRSGTIQTLGDVFIHPGASLQAGSVSCRNLCVHGTISGKFHCLGEARFQSDSKIIGSFECDRLVVSRKHKAVFLHPVRARSIDCRGQLFGDLFCSGSVKVSRHASVHGALLAKSLSIDPGGRLDGEFRICRDDEHAHQEATEADRNFEENRRSRIDLIGDFFGDPGPGAGSGLTAST